MSSTREAEPVSWVPAGVELRIVPWPRRPVQVAWSVGFGPRVDRSLGRLDVLHLTHPFPPASSSAPQVVTVNDIFPLERPEWYPRSERWTYRRGIALTVRRARRIVVPSHYVAERLVSVANVDSDRIAVVPLGVSGEFAAPPADGELEACCRRFGLEPGAFAVSLGAVTTRKNVLPLVRAIGSLGDASIPLVLIGGDGHGAAAVDAEIARLNGGARVVRTGFLPDRDATALVGAAGVLVHPALGEGFGFVPLEAMAAGTPVIAARSSSVPEVVGDAGVLVDQPERPASWATAVRELMADGARREALAAAGRRRAAEFSWERTARKMLEVYADAAGS